ncbi:MAG TPA: FAD-dependent oxidoreductase [Thermoguttaceae bacterium]|nr:FAD-dependent oxidoreductase [Thermoguttaceae bacterium]
MASQSSAWRCRVCGYIHRGPEPPEVCPVCGASREEFEPYGEEPKRPDRGAKDRWRCVVCKHVHQGDALPGVCPVCGAAPDSFEPVDQASGESADSGKALKLVVVGAGIAGTAAVESIREASARAEITLVSREPGLPYYRLNLTRYLAGEVKAEQLPIHPEGWYEDRDVRLLRGAEVVSLRPAEQVVELRGGRRLRYDRLLLAAGAHPFLPPFPGATREGVTALRTVAHADQIIEAAGSGAKCVCIGGGILGLETAAALAGRGVDVTLLEGHGWLLPRQLNQRAGEVLAEQVVGGIKLRSHCRTREIVGDERVRGVLLEDGEMIPADLVVIATGIRPNSYLARLAGLTVDRGVVVDDTLETSHPNVFAAGDVAEHRGVIYGIWGPSQHQGSIAGLNMVGIRTEFGGIPRSNTLKVLGVDLFSIGRITAEDGSFEAIDRHRDGRYSRFVFHDNYLVGAILLGDTTLTARVKSAIERREDFSRELQNGPNGEQFAAHLSAGSERA